MISKPILCVVSALTLAIGSSAFAQGRGHDDRNDRNDRGNSRDDRGNSRDVRNDRNDHRGGPGYAGPRGAGPEHNFYKGGRLPVQYRSRQYVVDDWRSHRLSAPPRGYHWVQTGGDYVLAAIATGVIASILLNN